MNAGMQILKIRNQTRNLAAFLKGQDTLLERFLPPTLSGEKEPLKAGFLADLILFWTVQADLQLDPESLRHIRSWMYESVLYLLTQCTDSDHTLLSILKILRLSLDTREIMFGDEKHKGLFRHLASELFPPISEDELELVFYSMAASLHDLQKRFEQLSAFMKKLPNC